MRKKLLLLFLFLTSALYSQTGKIAGQITEKESGEPVPFVNVGIEATNMGAAADIEGYYAILNVRPGKYTLRISAVGYRTVVLKDVQVSIDLTTKIDMELEQESLELAEDVIVVAEKPMITKDLTASTALVGTEEIEALPVTEFSEVLELQAGVVGGKVRGGRSGEIMYSIDGVQITDVFDGSTVIDVNTSAIQEMQFISGAFNAEYGRALSGVVNLATKEGGIETGGSFTTYFGDYFSTRTQIFRDIDSFDPVNILNFNGTIYGPIYKNYVSYFLNSRYVYFGGWLNGKREYNPWDITTNLDPAAPLDERYVIEKTGDGEIVNMNWNEKIYVQGKITINPFAGVKINYTNILDKIRYQDYNHEMVLNPDGRYKRFRWSNTNILGITHALSSSTFYTLNFSNFFKEYKHFVHEDLDDPAWTHNRLLDQEPAEMPSFNTGGEYKGRYRRVTDEYGVKLDFTSQVTRIHQIKTGVDLKLRTLSEYSANLLTWIDRNENGIFDPGEDGISEPQITGNPFVRVRAPDINNPDENMSVNTFISKPMEFSFYIQDKIELDEMIVNIGVRFDYFEPDGKILTDPSDPDIYRPRKPENIAKTLEERRRYWYKEATAKYQLSPRLGIAFPITDQGVVHFSYGHFFQVPRYYLLYSNPEYKFDYGTGNLGIAGNPDLKPEQTISGEIGVQQAITENISIDLTGYIRDVRDLTGTRADEIYIFGGTNKYSQYVNSDFGFIKGIILSVNKRFSDNWSASLDYTLQSAKGNASDPNATRNQLAGGVQPEIQLIRLDWDQTHTVNGTFNYSTSNCGFSLIGQFGSGFPYTPSQSMNLSKLLNNSELKPSTVNLDLRGYYDFYPFDFMKMTIFTRIYNVFDIRNEVNVYSDSGTADFTLTEYLRRQGGKPEIINTLDEYYRNPTFYSEPRRIEIGFTLNFE